jgi:choline transport protein
MSPTFTPHPWQQFLLYLAYTLIAFLINAFATRLLPYVTQTAFIWSIVGFVVISITLLACASPTYQPASFVYGDFINETGWPDGLAWLLGLLQGALALTGFDAVAHMIEEIPNPTTEGPKIMLACVGIGLFTGFIFLSVLLFVLHDLDTILTSAAGPLLQIFYDATNNRAGSVCLLMFPLLCLLFATVSIMTTSSRMTYAFARDGGLPFSRVFAKVHPTLDLPLNALIATAACVVIFGCIFLGSSSAFNAIVSASVVALGITYAIPPAINCLQGRTKLPEDRPFKLRGALGWVANLIGIAFALLTTVLFVFPPFLPVTGSNMNYCIVAFGVVLVISGVQWIVDGRKNFHGPAIEKEVLERAQTGVAGTLAGLSTGDTRVEGEDINGRVGEGERKEEVRKEV